MATFQEITAVYLSERRRFENTSGDVIIGSAISDGKPIAIKGALNGSGELVAQQTYRFYGYPQAYTNPRTGIKENQFCFKTFVRAQPASKAGIVAYIKSLKLPGIGGQRAAKLFDKFGADTIRVMRETPEVVAAAISGVSLEKVEAAAKILEKEWRTEATKIELIELFAGRGFRLSLADDCIKAFGNRAAEIVKRSPYRLMRFSGVGFKRADALYLDQGGNPAALKRQALCIAHAVQSNTNGDTWLIGSVARRELAGSIGGAEVQYDKALRLAIRAKLLSAIYTDGLRGEPTWDGETQWIAARGRAANEKRIADCVAEALQETVAWNDAFEFNNWADASGLTDHQVDNLFNAVGGTIGILGGSPGTGKTYTAAAFVRAAAESIGLDSIAIAAPTGKAAVRITEAMQENGVGLRAKTIHSLLRVESADDGGWSFQHGRNNPLPYRLIIVDESSMIDADIMAALLAARGKGASILFVGDVNQLPPVGHGAPLRDLIAVGVPYGELREIKRNSGGIVEACAAIRDGCDFEPGDNLRVAEAATPQYQIAIVESLLNGVVGIGDDPVWDAQILVPVNKKSPICRREMNKLLRGKLNNANESREPFWLNDKVVCLKNGLYLAIGETKRKIEQRKEREADDEIEADEAGRVYVANGEIGRVINVAAKYFEVALTSPAREIRVPRGVVDQTDDSADEAGDSDSGFGCDWDLAYCLSVHKSQGSEFPHVIVLVDEYAGAKRLCLREWWYTAISRARKQCHLVGRLATAQDGCRRQSLSLRKTFLRELLTAKMPSPELALT